MEIHNCGTSYKTKEVGKFKSFLNTCVKQRYLLLMVLPSIVIIFLFNYLPMYGLVIAFKDFNIGKGIIGSPWVGLKWFRTFFSNPMAVRLIKNTLLLGLYYLLWSFPAPIILSILLNEVRNTKFKRFAQTISYLPHFISVIIMIGLLKELCSIDGIFNEIRRAFGLEAVNFFARPEYFRTLFIGSGIWQHLGWGTIIYLATISSISLEMYEAAYIDGANRWHRIIYITLPAMKSTIMVLFILNVGRILSLDYQKVLLMYNPQTYSTADIIGTYTYREGLQNARYSYSAAVGLFMSIISFIFVFVTNKLSKMTTESSLW